MNKKVFEKTIAIDFKGTEVYEQTYSYDGNHVWVHIISLVDRFDPRCIENDLIHFTKSFLRNEKEKKNLFSNNRAENCISINISNGEICCGEVYLIKMLTFEEADEILLFKNSELLYLNEWIRIFYETGKSLRKKQMNSEKFTEKFLMACVISELSNFVSAKFGEFMLQTDNLNGVSKIRLYVNPFEFDSQNDKTELINLFRDVASTSAFYSDFIKTRFFTFKAKDLLKIDLEKEPNVDSIEIFKTAFLYLKNVLINFDFETSDSNKKIELIRDISILFNKSIFPQFNYFRFWINKYRPERAEYQFFEREKAENVYNFDTNYKYYSKLSEVFTDPWNFVYIYLIYKSLCPENRIDFVEKVNRSISLHERAYSKNLSKEKTKRKRDEADKLFTESLSFYSVVVENLKDPKNDFIVRLKFPTVLSYFQIPVNPALNFSKLFAKWKPEINENELKLKILIHFTNNLSTDRSKTTQNINAESWKETIDLMDFKLIYNLDVLNSNEKLFERLRQSKDDFIHNSKTTNDEDSFTLNTGLSLNYTFNSIRSGHVLVVQVNVFNKFTNELNSFVNEDYEKYKIKKPDAEDPSSKPHIELIRFNKLIHYCFVHHSKAKSQEFIWMISNLEIVKLNEPKRFKSTIKVTEFTEKFWLNSDKKPNKVCLSFKNSIIENKSFDDIDYLVYTDDEYINVFHGEVIAFDQMIQNYSRHSKELKELELTLEFEKDFSMPIKKLATLEIYYDDLLEEKRKQEQEYKEKVARADRQAEIQKNRDREIEDRNRNWSNYNYAGSSKTRNQNPRSYIWQNNQRQKSPEEESDWRRNN